MIYRGPCFLADVLFSSMATPCPRLLSVSLTGVTQDDGHRDTTCSRERGKGVGEEPNHTTARKPDSPSIIQYSLGEAYLKGRGVLANCYWAFLT